MYADVRSKKKKEKRNKYGMNGEAMVYQQSRVAEN